ncbi:MAG: hypothetical protein KDC52_08930 [Ignavibacteriae bacterium]|nr:hypothetical protein [Ignavibacteriota bacterium]MCB0751583.1 hypothetical protein [Ignavibacteriota bacterium]
MNKNKLLSSVFILFIFLSSGILLAQTDEEVQKLREEVANLKHGTSTFLLRGYAHSGLEIDDNKNSFVGGSFNPIFLWKQSANLIFESELELELADGNTIVGLEYADMSYFLNDYITLRLGKILIPFGTFVERLHPRWINRLPSNPLGFSHEEQVGPRSQVGIEIRGALQIFKGAGLNYSLYLVNGPNLNNGSVEIEEAGKLHYDNFSDNNRNKAVGGRIGILPLDDASLEIGFSGQFGKVGDTGSEYKDISASLYSTDLSLVQRINFLKSMLDIKAQWNRSTVDDAFYVSENEINGTYTFKNVSDAYYGQLALKPAFVSNELLNHLEFVARFSELNLPKEAAWGGEKSQLTFGINYWIDWRTVIKFGYQTLEIRKEGESNNKVNSFLMHWSIGF